MIHVVVVDDHDLVRNGIVRLLSDVKGIKVVSEARSGEEAISAAKEFSPDIMLMDVRMPGMDGLEATRTITKRWPDIRILCVTACSSDPYPARLIKAGARGFITKEADISEMELAIQTINRGQTFISAEIAQRIAISSTNDDMKAGGPFEDLSERELQICDLIISGRSSLEIADKLCLSPKTVSTYRYRMFEKLKIRNDVELALLAVKHGLLDPNESV